MSYWGYKPYVSVEQRRANAAKQVKLLQKKGQTVSPVAIEGRRIAASFWGKAWCDNLERYSDYANRLPRGRTCVRNGSVIDLSIGVGCIKALVSGSQIYKVRIDIAPATAQRWRAICVDCTGSIGSIVELLQGKLAKKVMERVCREGDGLFPGPSEIKLACSCPDWAEMCKHVAAVLYGIGARFDADPDALFTLRGVDRNELIALAADPSMTEVAVTNENVLADDDMAALFGIELDIPLSPTVNAQIMKHLPKSVSGKRPTKKYGVMEKAREAEKSIKPPRRAARSDKLTAASPPADVFEVISPPAPSQSAKLLVEIRDEVRPDPTNVDSKTPRTITQKSAARPVERPVRLSVRKKLAEESQSKGRGRRV